MSEVVFLESRLFQNSWYKIFRLGCHAFKIVTESDRELEESLIKIIVT